MSLNTRCYAHATDDVHVISGGFSWNGNDFNCAVILRLVGTEKHVDIEGAPCHRPGMLFCPDGHALRQWAEEINSTFLAFISPSQSPVSIDYQSMVSGASSTSTATRLVMRGNPAIEIEVWSRQHEPERDAFSHTRTIHYHALNSYKSRTCRISVSSTSKIFGRTRSVCPCRTNAT